MPTRSAHQSAGYTDIDDHLTGLEAQADQLKKVVRQISLGLFRLGCDGNVVR